VPLGTGDDDATLDQRRSATSGLIDASEAARGRGDWVSALALVEAAEKLEPDDQLIASLVETARRGAAADAGEAGARRQVTVMFCDLVGSTELASSLDPEEMREILAAYHTACGDVVGRYDGHVAHFMGDGLLAYFGYPRAHEDDGLRAVMAAIEMRAATSALRVPSSGRQLHLQTRIGIHTGLAVLSLTNRGTWSRPGDIAGQTPNLAARVQGVAAPETIVISAETLLLVRGRVDVEPLGMCELKGIDTPVELFQVTSLRTTYDDGPAAIAVGRDNELAVLERCWKKLPEVGTYVAVAGEAGIGKTHLVGQLRHIIGPSGGLILTFRCSELDANTSLAPVTRYLAGRLTGAANEDERLELLAGLSDLAGSVDDERLFLLATLTGVAWPADRPIPDLQPEQIRERTLLVLVSWLDALAAERPLVVVVEDLQWADPSTVDLLRRLVTAERPLPSMIVVTIRSEAASLPGEPTIIALEALDEASCAELIDALTGMRFDAATRAMIAQRGDGVPLYICEVARMLESTDPAGPDPAATDHNSADVAIPPTLNDLLVARLDAFPTHRSVIEALAVLGRPSSVDVLADFIRSTTTDVQRQLDTLDSAGIVRYSSDPPEYDFRHSLLREVAYQVQLLAQRRELHARAATVLESAFAASHDGRPQVLGHHLEMAGALDRAAVQWVRAGLRQAGFAAHSEAIASFERVVVLLEHGDNSGGELERQARTGLAASLLAARGYTAAEVGEAYARVRELSIGTDRRTEVISLYGMWAYYHVTGNAVASLEAAEAMVDHASASTDRQADFATRAVLGYQLSRFGRLVEAVDLLALGRSWSAPEPLFPHHAGIGATANLAMVQWLLGRFEVARATIADAVDAAEAMTGPTAHFSRAYTHAFAAEMFQVSGHPGVAAQHAGRTVGVSTEFGFTSWLGAGMTNLKVGEALAGDPAEAIPVIEYCLGAWRGAGAASSLTQFGLGLALAYQRAGRLDEAIAVIDTALADAEASDERFIEPDLHRVRAEVLAALDPTSAEATQAFDRAVALATAQGAKALLLRALTSVAQRHRTTGQGHDVAQQLSGLLAELDPSGADAEPVLVAARAALEQGVS